MKMAPVDWSVGANVALIVNELSKFILNLELIGSPENGFATHT